MSDETKDEIEEKIEVEGVEGNEESFIDDPISEEMGTDERDEGETKDSKLVDLFTNNKTAMTLALGLTGIAIFLVLIVGIFSSVTFLTILWRMFIGAIFFFIFGFGLGVLVQYFVPGISELFEGAGFNSEDLLGENLDLVAGDMDDSVYTDAFHQDDRMEEERGDLSSAKSIESQFNIPNDPELMAKAVKTILHKDD